MGDRARRPRKNYLRLLILPTLVLAAGCAAPGGVSEFRAASDDSAQEPRFIGVNFIPQVPVRPPEPLRVEVRFPSNDADLYGGTATILEAVLYRPRGKGPFPAVIALHDCQGLYSPTGAMNSHMRDWAERLVAEGYAVLMPDSFNPRGVPEMCGRDPELIRPGAERARDASAALDWLQSRSWIIGDRVGLVGWANGGTTALTFATSDGRLPPRPGKADFRLIVAFYPNCATLAQAPGWRTDMPMTVLDGTKDDWAPAKPCVDLADRIHSAGGAVDLVRYDGAYHDFDAPGMPLHLKAGLTTTASGGAIIGTDPIARADAVDRVMALLAGGLER